MLHGLSSAKYVTKCSVRSYQAFLGRVLLEVFSLNVLPSVSEGQIEISTIVVPGRIETVLEANDQPQSHAYAQFFRDIGSGDGCGAAYYSLQLWRYRYEFGCQSAHFPVVSRSGYRSKYKN